MSRTPGQRAGLSRDAVLAAARTVFAERGLTGLSMRSVAGELGVAPNALYSHVTDKDALVDALLDDLLGTLTPPPPDADPITGLRGTMLATFDLLGRHADLVPLYLARQGARGPHARALGEAMVVLLGRLGVEETAGRVVRALVVSTLGYAALATADAPMGTAELRADLEVTLDWLLRGATDRRTAG